MSRFDLSRWFAGIASVTDEERAAYASPENDARVRHAVDGLPVTVFEFDADGIYTCVAGKYVGLFGVRAAQVVGRSVFDFPRFVPGKNMMVRRALAGETVAFTGIWPLGRFMIRLHPHLDREGSVTSVAGIGYEIAKPAATDKQIEELLEALRQSEARFRVMCECAPLGIFVANPKLELGYVNPALCALLERGSDELLGRPWRSALQADDEELLYRPPDAEARAAGAYDGVLRMAGQRGSRMWISVRIAEMRDGGGEVLGYVGAIADITQERAARLAIDRAQQDLRRVIESSPEGIAIVRDGCFVFVNRAMAEALGHARPEDLLGQSAGAIVHPDDRLRAREFTARPRPISEGAVHELRYRRAGGDYVLMEIRAAALGEFEGAPAVMISARDVTERRKLQLQLNVTERLLSVGTLAAGLAHEVNNPLAAVVSNLEWVAARVAELSGREAEAETAPAAASDLRAELGRLSRPLADAREAAARVHAIVRDLKLFSRAEEDIAGPVDLTAVLDSTARIASNEVRHRARFVRDYGELPTVNGSDARLGQVFLNLIINAAQAIPEGRAEENEIRVSARALAPDRVVVEVHDTGSGIAKEIADRIFDPFFTTKPPGVGSGLGLAICHRIVSSLGGRIDVESRPGEGSTFRVTLRSVSAAAQPRASSSSPAAPAAAGVSRGRVLVIDDDPAIGNAIGLVLREHHVVEVLTSAQDALARLRAGERYDAIVCDLMMPQMSGIDFHGELARIDPELAARVIFLTGGAFTVAAREFLDRVNNPRLDKPFDAQDLRALVGRQVGAAGQPGAGVDPS